MRLSNVPSIRVLALLRFQFRSYLEKHFREPGSSPRDGVAQQKHNDAVGVGGGLASHLQAGAVGV